MKWRALVAASIGVLAFAAPAASAAAEQPHALEVKSIDVSGYPTIRAIVTAPIGAVISESPAGFRVTEGASARPPTVKLLPSAGMAVVLVMDTSASMRGTAMNAARQAAIAFVNSMPAAVPVAVIGFGNAPTVHSPFGTDRAATTQALSHLVSRGNTTLYDAVLKGAALHAARPQAGDARKVMVVLTDGGDTRSAASLADVTAVLRTSGVSLSAVALATRESDLASLTLLASSAGGTVVSATDPAALNGVFQGISQSVLSQYAVTWTAAAGGLTAITIDLNVGPTLYRSVQNVSFPALPVATDLRPPVTAAALTQRPQPTPFLMPASGDGRRWLFLGIGTGFLSLLGASGVVLWPRAPRRRLAKEFGQEESRQLATPTKRIIAGAEQLLAGHDRQNRLQGLLERAGMRTEPATAVVSVGLVAILCFAIGLAVASVVVALVLALCGVVVQYLWIRIRADRRSAAFQEQLESTLQIMTNSLKAGYGIGQAIDTVAREAEAPTNEEFRRVMRETGLGMDQVEALEACARRVVCEDLLWVTDAIAVNRDVGGNLSELFAGVSETIRSRNRLARQVVALSAEGRISAKILIGLPLVVIAVLSATNRSYVGELFRGPGPYLLAGAALMMIVGYIWTRRIVRVDY